MKYILELDKVLKDLGEMTDLDPYETKYRPMDRIDPKVFETMSLVHATEDYKREKLLFKIMAATSMDEIISMGITIENVMDLLPNASLIDGVDRKNFRPDTSRRVSGLQRVNDGSRRRCL